MGRFSTLAPLSLVLVAGLAGCVGSPPSGPPSGVASDSGGPGVSQAEDEPWPATLDGAAALPIKKPTPSEAAAALGLAFQLLPVGVPGPEPSIGLTTDGTIFFQAMEKTMRSRDHGGSFQETKGLLTATTTSDPYLWVDPATDRVFQANMLNLVCTHIAWSDDGGESWLGNPLDCGPVPINDHIKVATGPWTGTLDGVPHPTYPNAVYFAHNKLAGAFMAVSLDGGATFPLESLIYKAGCAGGLHGSIAVAPDGTVYVPARFCPGPLVAVSHDNGLTWTSTIVGSATGVPKLQKNPEIAIDAAGNAFLTWVGADNLLYVSASRDQGSTWTEPVRASPEAARSVVFPTIVAGDAGRIAIAYLATEDTSAPASDAPDETRWHLYYTTALDALAPNPTFATLRVTPADDPVQRGSICLEGLSCGEARNLLDFIDLALDREGRAYVAFADGCTSEACRAAEGRPSDSRDDAGMVAVVQRGPSLRDGAAPLKPLR